MKKNILKLVLLVVLTNVETKIFSADMFEEFKNNFQQQYVDPVAKDLTAVLCVNSLNQGSGLGLFSATPPSIGLNIRLYAPMKKIASDNILFKDGLGDVEYIFLPVVQVEKGLPAKIDLIFRGISLGDVTMYGIGIKYCIFKSILPLMPEVSFAGFYNQLIAKDILSLNAISLNAIVSLGVPVLTPYVVIGIDNGNLKVDNNVILGDLSGKLSNGIRYEAGINLSLVPFMYLNFSYGQAYSDTTMSAGIGLKF